MDGRFDLIVLHMVLLLARLDREGPSTRDLGQNLFDHFCRDLDANLREMGVGDLVPKRMRQFAEAFYGRQTAYLAAFDTPDGRELEKALARNIFQGVNGGLDRAAWRVMRAPWRVNLSSRIKRPCCAALLIFPTRRPFRCPSTKRQNPPRHGTSR
jgi:hypothetical protein